jgi:hypothetical protein
MLNVRSTARGVRSKIVSVRALPVPALLMDEFAHSPKRSATQEPPYGPNRNRTPGGAFFKRRLAQLAARLENGCRHSSARMRAAIRGTKRYGISARR